MTNNSFVHLLNFCFQGCLLSKDVFANFLDLCKYNYEIIQKVFNNPEQVMAKFVLNIYKLKIAEYIDQRLNSKLGSYGFLQTLYELYSKLVIQSLYPQRFNLLI